MAATLGELALELESGNELLLENSSTFLLEDTEGEMDNRKLRPK